MRAMSCVGKRDPRQPLGSPGLVFEGGVLPAGGCCINLPNSSPRDFITWSRPAEPPGCPPPEKLSALQIKGVQCPCVTPFVKSKHCTARHTCGFFGFLATHCLQTRLAESPIAFAKSGSDKITPAEMITRRSGMRAAFIVLTFKILSHPRQRKWIKCIFHSSWSLSRLRIQGTEQVAHDNRGII